MDAEIASATKGDWQGYYNRMGRTAEEYYTTVIFSDAIDRIVKSNPYEEVSSGDQEDKVMSLGDTNSFLRIHLA